MILTSTTETVPFTPVWHCDDGGQPKPGAPVYDLRAGSVIERGQLEAELAGMYQARRVFGFELDAALRAGVAKLLHGDPELDRVLAAIAAEAELEAENGEREPDQRCELPEDQARLLTEVRDVMAQHWPEYRDLVARAERRRELVPVLAFRRFCAGWTGPKTPHARGRDGLITDAALRGVDPLDIFAAGNRAYSMLYVDEDQAGNSARPDTSGNGPRSSDSDDTLMEAGSSPADAGRKTRASRSRR